VIKCKIEKPELRKHYGGKEEAFKRSNGLV
jgi:hypothetical protein